MNNSIPDVTILIPVYNRTEYLGECLDSALNQTYPNCKILIYDDGSDEESLKKIQVILASKSSDEQQRIKFESGQHRGIGYARDHLLYHFDSSYACWLDSDDIMPPERVEKQLKALKQQTVDILFCSMELFKPHRRNKKNHHKVIKADINKYSNYKSLRNNTTSPTGFFSRKVKKYRFNFNLTLGGEDALWIYQLIQGGIRIGYLDEVLYLYRKHENRIGRKKRLRRNLGRVEFEEEIIANEIKGIQSSKKKFEDWSMRIKGDELGVIERFIYSNGIIFDVGANLGLWATNVFQRKLNCTFHLFEPSDLLFEKLSFNLQDEINNKMVIVNHQALSDCIKTKPFYYYPKFPGNSSFHQIISSEGPPYNLGKPEVSKVTTITLDEYCNRKEISQINFLKIDTEGSEWEVLKGAENLISKGKIDFIQFEYGACYRESNSTLEEVYLFLTKNGYDIFKILPNELKYIKQFLQEYEDYAWCNFLAVNKRFRNV